jgi:hypothetical protein
VTTEDICVGGRGDSNLSGLVVIKGEMKEIL